MKSSYYILALLYFYFGQQFRLHAQSNNPAPYPPVAYVNVPCSQPNGSNAPGNSINDFIDNVYTTGATLNFTNMNSGCNQLQNNYINYGCTFNMGATAGQTITCNIMSGQTYAQGFAMWIDLDGDLTFSTLEKVGATVGYPNAATWTSFTFAIPTNQANGVYRMRIRSAYITSGADPLFTSTSLQDFGETEDYNIYVGIPPPVVITASATASPSILCPGGSFSLTAAHNITTTASFTWTGPPTFTSSAQNTVVTNATGAASGVYTFVASDGICSATRTVQVTVSDPSFTLSASNPICAGDTVKLNAQSGGGIALTYTWTGPANFSISSQSAAIPNASTIHTGIYSVTAASGTCLKSDTVGVVVRNYPVVTLSADSVCAGQSLVLLSIITPAVPMWYTWTGPNGILISTQNATITPANTSATGIYTLVVNDMFCPVTETVSAVVIDYPVVYLSYNYPVCDGNSITFTTNVQGIGQHTYQWSGPLSFTNNVQNAVVNNAGMNAQGVYSVSVKNELCSTGATVDVVITPFPTFTVAVPAPICAGQTLSLTAVSTGTRSYFYNWAGPNNFSYNQPAGTIPSATSSMTGIYTVSATDAICITTNTINAVIIDYPLFTITAPSTLCVGQNINLDAIPSVSGPYNYSWSGPLSFSSTASSTMVSNATTTNSGTYSVVVANGGCVTTATTSALVLDNPSFTLSSSSPICAGQSLSLSATPILNGNYTYTWTGPNNFLLPQQNGVLTSAASSLTGIYSVTAVNGICPSAATIQAVVIDYPIITVSAAATVCVGQNLSFSVTPSGSSSYSYYWSGPSSFSSNIQNPVITNANALTAGIYSVSVADGACNTTSTVGANVVAAPTLSLAASTPVCSGQTFSLTSVVNGPSNYSYGWVGPAGFNSTQQNPLVFNPTPAGTGSYSLSVSDGICTVTQTVAAVILEYPDVSLFVTDTICPSQTFTMIAIPQTTVMPQYAWTGPANFTSALQSPTITNAQQNLSGKYYLVSSNAQCSVIDSLDVVVRSYPAYSLAVSSPVCEGQSLSFTATPGGTIQLTYNWSGPSAFSSNSQNPVISNAQTGSTGIYTVAVSDGFCPTSSTIQARVYEYPTFTLAASPTICAGQTLSLTTITGGTFSPAFLWSGPAGFNSSSNSPILKTTHSGMTGNYSVTISNSMCAVSGSVYALIVNYPVFSITSPTPVCSGGSVSLATDYNSVYPTTYTWTGPMNFISNSATITLQSLNVDMAGSYSVAVESHGCKSVVSSVKLMVYPLPVIAASETSPTICLNSSVTLQVLTSAASVQWSPATGLQSSAGTSVIASPSISQQYKAIASANGCTNAAHINVNVMPIPTPTITASKKVVCSGDTITLRGAGGNLYKWEGPYSKVYGGEILAVKVSSISTGNYTLIITNAFGCTNKAVTALTIQPAPQGELIGYKESGCVPFCGKYKFVPKIDSVNTSALTTSSWRVNDQSTNSNSFSYCYSKSGLYIINGRIYDPKTGCTNNVDYSVTVRARPEADFIYTPIRPADNIDQVSFINNSFGEEIVKWNWYINDEGKTESSEKEFNHMFTEGGIYTIAMIATNVWKCSDTAIKTITVLSESNFYVPDAFTPNGDGLNDVFLPIPRNVRNFTLFVYDRWGHQIFFSRDANTGWDGKFHEAECKTDHYTWKVEFTPADGARKEIAGRVLLLR